MKSYMLFFLFFAPFFCFAQVSESFADGNFTQNPTWTGTISNFIVNQQSQLQSAAPGASTSYLFTLSSAIKTATWECRLKIDYPTSSSNYACIYLISDVNSLENGFNGYFVQAGGANDEVSLFLQEGLRKVKIIDGVDKRTDGKVVEIYVRATRDSLGVFRLYSRLPSESEYFLEGEIQHVEVLKSRYFGLSYTNTGSTGTCYYFDDIQVIGSKLTDNTPPELIRLSITDSDKLSLSFSESMNYSDLQIRVNSEPVEITAIEIADNQTSVEIVLAVVFAKGKIYEVEIENLKDEAGNLLCNSRRHVGVVESANAGDIVFNEVMFHHADSAAEYIELYNRSEKTIDIGGMIFTTLKSDSSFNSGNVIPEGVLMFPHTIMALTSDTAVVRKYHACPPEAKILQTGWTSLNNTSSTLLLMNAAKDTVLDQFSYDVSMHHVLIKNPKGVALERINPHNATLDISNWHSAASSHRFGTPGFVNSQYRNMDVVSGEEEFYFEHLVFSPDNDGDNDVCVMHYNFPEVGRILNVEVLTATGEKVYTLAQQFLSGREGVLTWDGRNQQGKLANIGVYVFYIEIFNPNNGKRNQVKFPVVLSSR